MYDVSSSAYNALHVQVYLTLVDRSVPGQFFKRVN